MDFAVGSFRNIHQALDAAEQACYLGLQFFHPCYEVIDLRSVGVSQVFDGF